MAAGTAEALPGIHHVTAICSDPQRNVDFYAGVLGLRLVKRTVNFDDPGTYHLYYGDGVGTPGTIMTFFAWILPPFVRANARQGTGQITATAFSIPESSLDYWIERLSRAGVEVDAHERRFSEPVISFRDPDGLPLELVARPGKTHGVYWKDSPVPREHAIRAIGGATFSLTGFERTAELLAETMGFLRIGQEGSHYRFQLGEGDAAAMTDIHCQPEGEAGRMGIGAVHHVAWRTSTPEAQQRWREVLVSNGFDVTPVLDRNYFESIYFREPGGILFEIATDPPGFTVDESAEVLGRRLKLPPWLEGRRAHLEATLPDLRVPAGAR